MKSFKDMLFEGLFDNYLIDPTPKKMFGLMKRTYYKAIRFVEIQNMLYVWDGGSYTHHEFIHAVSIRLSLDLSSKAEAYRESNQGLVALDTRVPSYINLGINLYKNNKIVKEFFEKYLIPYINTKKYMNNISYKSPHLITNNEVFWNARTI